MKTIGLIGGMSWESTIPYYRQINEAIKQRLGGLHSAKILLYSVDFQEVEALQHSGQWERAGELLADVARRLETDGADGLDRTSTRLTTSHYCATRMPAS